MDILTNFVENELMEHAALTATGVPSQQATNIVLSHWGADDDDDDWDDDDDIDWDEDI